MSRSRFAVGLISCVLSAALVAPSGAAPASEPTGAQATQQRQQSTAKAKAKSNAKKAPTKRKQAAPRKTPPKTQPKATQPASPKPATRAPVDTGPRASTDTQGKITRAGDHIFSIQHGGVARTYRVHVPATFSPATPAPLLVALHGGGGNMDAQANDAWYGLVAKSEREGFVAVFPNGYSKLPGARLATWNAGQCCGPARDENVDDVGFIRKVVENVFLQMSIDRHRIYAAGMSNGAMMAYRLACDAPGLFRGIAAVAGTDNTGNCATSHPVPVVHIHARDDSHVLFNGGAGPDAVDRSRVPDFTSVPATVSKWAQRNGCSATPRRILDTAGAYCEVHSWCRGQADVQLCVTDTGGHSWPGGQSPRGARTPSQAISATDVMWDFLSRH